jgi:hypothetical protein
VVVLPVLPGFDRLAALFSVCLGGTTLFFEQLVSVKNPAALKASKTQIFFLISNIYVFKFNHSFWLIATMLILKSEEAGGRIAEHGFLNTE